MTQGTKSFHVLSGVLTLLTLSLITLGGIVHNTGSSLACPDWPLCFGQVMPKMEGAVAIEHSHRLLATLVGFINIVLVAISWGFRKSHPKIFKWTVFALLAVILQGVLGGITVLLRISPLVSTFHLGLSQLYFALTIYLFIKSRPQGFPDAQNAARPDAKVFKLLGIVTGLLFIQIIVGAAVRHTGAGAACGLGPEYSVLCMEAETGGTTWWPSQIQSQFHVLHRYFGVLMVFLLGGLTVPLLKWAKNFKVASVRKLIGISHGIVTVQVGLGVLTVATHIGPHGVTAHLLFAALLWANLVAMNILARQAKRA